MVLLTVVVVSLVVLGLVLLVMLLVLLLLLVYATLINDEVKGDVLSVVAVASELLLGLVLMCQC